MKPFDLEAAKRGDPICSRDGTPVKFIAHVPEAAENQQLLVLIHNSVRIYYTDGSYYKKSPDLFMATKKRTVWVNLYPSNGAGYYDTEDKANYVTNYVAGNNRIGGKAWPLEIEE